MINLYNMNCMEFLKNIPDKKYSIAIIDPPYGIKAGGCYDVTPKMHGSSKALRSGWNINWDNEAPDKNYFAELFRVSKHQIIFGANHFISKIPYDSSCWIIWDKGIPEGMDFAPVELAWSSYKCGAKFFKFTWSGFWQGDMQNKEKKIHPTQKPVALYKYLLNTFANQGDTILDTHLGSGSIAIACHDLGFNLDATELDNTFYNDAKTRLEQHQRQLTLDLDITDTPTKNHQQIALDLN